MRSCSIRARTSWKLGGDDDLPAGLLLQLGDLGHHVALEDRGVGPFRFLERGGCHVLGHAVEHVRQLAAPKWPPRGQELIAPLAQQLGLGSQCLLEQDLGRLFATSAADTADPAAAAESLVTDRVLDDPVEGNVLADDDLSYGRFFFGGRCRCH